MTDRVTLLAEAVHAALPEPVPFEVGARALFEHAAPPRVVWVPVSDRFAGPHVAGGKTPSRLTIERTVDLYLWHGSLEEVDRLESEVLLALWQTAAGSLELGDARWLTQEDAAWLTLGEALKLTVVFRMPVTEATKPTTRLLAAEATLLPRP